MKTRYLSVHFVENTARTEEISASTLRTFTFRGHSFTNASTVVKSIIQETCWTCISLTCTAEWMLKSKYLLFQGHSLTSTLTRIKVDYSLVPYAEKLAGTRATWENMLKTSTFLGLFLIHADIVIRHLRHVIIWTIMSTSSTQDSQFNKSMNQTTWSISLHFFLF